MLAGKSRPFSREGWLYELKLDGYRMLATKGQLLTRNKKDASTWYPEILTALDELKGSYIIDGEVVLLDENGRPNFEGMRARARKRGGALVTLFGFDLLWRNGKDLRALPLLTRKERLRKLIPPANSRIVFVEHIET